MSVDALQIHIVFLEELKRAPTSSENDHYTAELLNPGYTIDNIRSDIRSTIEYMKLNNTYAGQVSYDDSEWKIGVSDVYAANYSGVTLANGKIAMSTSGKHGKIENAFISSQFDFDTVGKYTNNVIKGFNYASILFFDQSQTGVSVSDTGLSQELNMYTAIFKDTYSLSSPATNPGATVAVQREIMTLRPYPYCALQTYTVTSDMDTEVDMFHEVSAAANINDVVYTNNMINTKNNNSGEDRNIYFFNAKGLIQDHIQASSNKKIVVSNAYVFDVSGTSFSNKGYNIKRNDTNVAYNKFSLSLVAGVPTKFHVVSCMMTEFDFPHPDIETNRILISMIHKGLAEVRAEHVTMWSTQWADSITLEAKAGITLDQSKEIEDVQRFIKFSLYNIYSVVRDDINVEVNPLNISTIDINGNIFWRAELWLIPVLLFIKPRAARSLLDYRYTMLENAKHLAAAHGFKGSKFPFENDVVGYNDVYWDNVSPLYIYNTALISIGVWNYYRITRDRDWLVKKGYEILKNNADFFMSKAELNETTGQYDIKNVYGMNNINADNNSLTNYLAKMALKYAIEATWELNYVLPPTWKTVRNGLKIETLNTDASGNINIVKLHSGYSDEQVKFLETFIMLHPYYSKDFFSENINFDKRTIDSNIKHAEDFSIIEEDYKSHYVNQTLLSSLYATKAQQESLYGEKSESIDKFYEHMVATMRDNTLQPWGSFYSRFMPSIKEPSCESSEFRGLNDIAISSAFILNILTGVCGLRVTGGINECRFLYEEYGIKSRTANVMPNTWLKMVVKGIGVEEKTYTFLNSLYQPGFC